MLDPSLTAVIFNPAAGGGKVGRAWPRTEAALRERLGDVRFVATSAPGDAARLAEQAVRDGRTTVLSLGGDGTHNEVVNGLMAAARPAGEVAFGVLPAGTGGDFARILAVPRDTIAAAEAIARSERLPLDVGRVTIRSVTPHQTRYFVNVCTFGFGGLVDQLVNESTKMFGGRVSFFVGALRALARYRPATVRLEVDGVGLGDLTVIAVAVGNGRYCGGGMMVTPTADPSDGVFEITIIERRPVVQLLGILGAVYSGRHVERDGVHVLRGRRMVAELVGDAPAYLDLDGEAPGVVPATIEVVPGALSLLGGAP